VKISTMRLVSRKALVCETGRQLHAAGLRLIDPSDASARASSASSRAPSPTASGGSDSRAIVGLGAGPLAVRRALTAGADAISFASRSTQITAETTLRPGSLIDGLDVDGDAVGQFLLARCELSDGLGDAGERAVGELLQRNISAPSGSAATTRSSASRLLDCADTGTMSARLARRQLGGTAAGVRAGAR
jgi:hypothetical protein